MRYMKGKIHFNKQELAALSKENPTLFELAERYADKAHMRVDVINPDNEGGIEVHRQCVNSSGKPCIGGLACPSQVFYVPDVPFGNDYNGDPTCGTMRCWNLRVDNQGKRPCWFRTWNEFVQDMHSPEVTDTECECDE